MAATRLSRAAIVAVAATILSLSQPAQSSPHVIANFLPALDINYPQTIASNSTFEAGYGGAAGHLAQASVSVEHIVELRVRQFLTDSSGSTSSDVGASGAGGFSVTAAGGCPNNYNACDNLNAPGVCCTRTALCTTDQAAHIACCPSGSICTGTIAVSTQSGATVSSISIATGTFTFIGVVSNSAYTMGVIPTSFPNAAVCSQAYSTCQVQYSNCLNQLGGTAAGDAGRSNGLTISASGGGTTVLPGASSVTTTLTDATDLCSSLSQSACMGLQTMFCSAYGGNSGNTGTSGTSAASRSRDGGAEMMLAISATLAAVIVAGAGFSLRASDAKRRQDSEDEAPRIDAEEIL